METPNIMLIGCGPHAKRVYVPKLKEAENEFGIITSTFFANY